MDESSPGIPLFEDQPDCIAVAQYRCDIFGAIRRKDVDCSTQLWFPPFYRHLPVALPRARASLCASSTAKRRRNVMRADSLLTIGAALSKQFTMPYNEHHSIQIRAEAVNLTNAVRFDVNQRSSA